MSCKEHEKIVAFDTLFSTNQIQMLKIILPFTDDKIQKFMAVYIKFLELQYTIDFCRNHPYSLFNDTFRDSSYNLTNLCDELLPFCNPREKKHFEQMRTIFQNMEMYREMSKTMEILKDFMPDMDDLFSTMSAASHSDQATEQDNITDSSSDAKTTAPFGFDITTMLMNMMTPEQKEMYEMFKGDNHAE